MTRLRGKFLLVGVCNSSTSWRLSELIFLFSLNLFFMIQRVIHRAKEFLFFSLTPLDWLVSTRDLICNKTTFAKFLDNISLSWGCCSLGAKRRAIVDDPPVRWDHPNARNQSRCHSILHEIILFQISSSVSWMWSTLTARLRICTCIPYCSIIGPAIDACARVCARSSSSMLLYLFILSSV